MTATTDRLETAIAAIPSCALDDAGRREQHARYMRLGANVAHLERLADAILIDFDQRLDRETLEQALAIERRCCPFFVFDLDEWRRRLRVTVGEREQLPALEALASLFGASERPRKEGRA
jgi:hypothetical protein